MIGYDRYLAILAESDTDIRLAAERTFANLLAKIRAGDSPQAALKAVLKEFNADTLAGFREALNAVLQSALSLAEVKAYPVGRVKLSAALYANARAVSASAQKIIEQHLQGVHDARELRKALYDGYDFKVDPLHIVKPLPKYLQVEFDKFKAASLKTPALRAAYLDAIRRAEAGAGMAALEKKLKVAFHERNRYLANRIAQTELHRNYTDQQAREWMATDDIQFLQWRMSRTHPKADICCRAGTLITTETGFKPIESVAMGDMVLTHRGRWQHVTQLYRRELDDTDTLVELEIQTESGRYHQVTLTPNHPVLTDQGWIPAGDLKTENLVFFSENIDSRPLGYDAFCKAPLGFLGSLITRGLKKVFSELCDGLLAWHPIRILHTFGLYFQATKFARKIDDDIYQHFYFLLSSLGYLPQSLTSIDDCADRQNGETCQDGVCHNSGYFPRFVADRRASSKSLLERWVKKQRRKWGMFLIGNDLSKIERQANVFQNAFGTYHRFCESWFPPINSYIHYGMISSKMIVQSNGETVFNLGVAGDQSYVAGGLVVHNCDRHARLNVYGLGPGIYPKALAPKPPAHPFCRCVLSSVINLDPDARPRFNPKAERAWLASLPAFDAREVAGSWEKRRRVLEEGESLEALYNEGKDPLYRWKTVGEVGQDRRMGSTKPIADRATIRQFLESDQADPISVAVLPADIREQLGADTDRILLSRYTADKQRKHPEVTADSYGWLQDLLARGERIADKTFHVVVIQHRGEWFVAVLKVAKAGDEVYLQSFRRSDAKDIAKLRGEKKK